LDPLSIFVVAILLALLNGAVLGIVHRDLPQDLRPAAFSWRFGTLLIAVGCILLVVQRELPAAPGILAGNIAICLGLTAYWRALRQFYGLPERWWLLIPTLLVFPAVLWFSLVSPDLPRRVLVVSLIDCLPLVGAFMTLWHARKGERAVSRWVLAVAIVFVIGFLLVRAFVVLASGEGMQSIMDPSAVINALTPMVMSILPVVGTTAFLQLCNERIRRHWERAASTDALTGLANRRTLVGEGRWRIDRARRLGQPLALAVIDIDRFKGINDRFGHEVGDRVLRQVADLLAQAAGENDLVARQGGEEFVMVLHDTDLPAAYTGLDELRRRIAASSLETSGAVVRVTVSIGLTALADDDSGLDDPLRRADAALYRAKSGGRDRIEIADAAAAMAGVAPG
jgi:diguanylate cyclase (GGDEF)-like protein